MRSEDDGVELTDIEYLVPDNKDKKQSAVLLRNVSGYFLPNEMAALMGPSGSGKTTLLDLLAGRKTTGQMNGEILFAAHHPTRTFLRRYTGYVEQFDTLLDILTVHEMLMYTAELKRPVSEPIARKREKVEDVIQKLALEDCRDTKIGNAMKRGISGGQCKRVNIGIALVSSARVLFLDEPTSGLDSYTANEVMTVVKALVKDGTTICATIHSPTPYSFSLFDRVMMLVQGSVAFFGERRHASTYFEAVAPATGPSLSTGNEAEWLTDVIVKADRMGKGSELAEKYNKSELSMENDRRLQAFMAEKTSIPSETLKELAVKRETVTPFFSALKTLIKYRTKKNYQDADYLGARLGDKFIFSLLILTLYWSVGDDIDGANFINISSILVMWCTLPAYGAAAYVPSIVLERELFTRERNDGLYRVITYLCAKMIDELLLSFSASAVFGAIIWFPVKLQGSFALFWVVYFLTLANGIVVAYFVAALSPNMDVANAALPTYVTTLLFFAGFLMRFEDIPRYWFWFTKLNFLTYAWGSLMVNQWADNPLHLSFGGEANVTVLEFYDLDDVEKWGYAGIEAAFAAGFFFLAFLALTFVKHSKR